MLHSPLSRDSEAAVGREPGYYRVVLRECAAKLTQLVHYAIVVPYPLPRGVGYLDARC